MRLLSGILFLFIFQASFSQDTVWVDNYYKKAESIEKREFFYLATETETEGEIKRYKIYYPSGKLRARYSSLSETRNTGTFEVFHENGQLQETGQYNGEGSRMGKWNMWKASGELVLTREFDPEEFTPRILFFRDSTGQVAVENGNGYYYEQDPEGWVDAAGPLENGVKTGTWEGYTEEGSLRYSEEYDSGKLLKGTSYDGGREIRYTQIQEPTIPKGGYRAFYEFISKNLIYPAEARRKNIQGKVFIQFVIDQKGNLTEPEIVRGIHASIDQEALRVVSKHKGWSIPLQRGLPVKQRIIVPIVFQLG